jgi:hypothetical protein
MEYIYAVTLAGDLFALYTTYVSDTVSPETEDWQEIIGQLAIENLEEYYDWSIGQHIFEVTVDFDGKK